MVFFLSRSGDLDTRSALLDHLLCPVISIRASRYSISCSLRLVE
jgi:hypothetical protein